MIVRTRPRHLPAEPDEFVGRERDTKEIIGLLAGTRMVTLAGPGGVGKSRLALRVAGRYESETDTELPVAFVEMADLDAAELLVPRVATTLGIGAETGRSLDDTLLDALRHGPTLLVLDNCEHLVDACARLCSAILSGGAGTRILATSREPLRMSGETVWRVPPLPMPEYGADARTADTADSVRLFVARAAAARPDFRLGPGNIGAVVRTCQVLEGMPLAIELAAARVRVLSVEQIAGRLDDRFRLLASGDRTAPERQRTLWDTVDWSHELLGQAERVLLRRLSVFSGGWTLEMAERVCADPADGDLPEPAVLDRLADLVDKSLVLTSGEVGGEMRYRMLETIRQYAAERLDASGERDELRHRHLRYMAALVTDAWRDTLSSRPAGADRVSALLERAGTEQGNVRSAMEWALETGELDPGVVICGVQTRGWWIPKGQLAEGIGLHERFLAALPPDAERQRARLHTECAELAIERRDDAAAARHAEEGLRLATRVGEDDQAAAALLVLAALDLRGGRTESAARQAAEAMRTAERGDDPWNLALACAAAANLAVATGDLDAVPPHLDRALRVARRLNNKWLVGRILSGRAGFAEVIGDTGEAARRYAEARDLFAAYEAKAEQARCHAGLARVALATGDLATAREECRASLRLTEAVGHGVATARGLAMAARVAEQYDALSDAVLLAAAAETLRSSLNVPPSRDGELPRLLERARARLGAETVDSLFTRGRGLTHADAVALAFSDGLPEPGRAAPPARSGEPTALTPREQEIAELLARGLSNRAVADELVIAPATVARHVANIFAKLDVSSRAQVAAWVEARRGAGGEGP